MSLLFHLQKNCPRGHQQTFGMFFHVEFCIVRCQIQLYKNLVQVSTIVKLPKKMNQKIYFQKDIFCYELECTENKQNKQEKKLWNILEKYKLLFTKYKLQFRFFCTMVSQIIRFSCQSHIRSLSLMFALTKFPSARSTLIATPLSCSVCVCVSVCQFFRLPVCQQSWVQLFGY